MTAATPADNPLLAPWTGPFELPPFRAIAADHMLPAFEAALAAHRDEIAALAGQTTAPTFENTIAGLERAGRTLTRVSGVFWNLASADTNPQLQALERELSPKLAQHWNEITANEPLFRRVEALWHDRDGLDLDEEQARLLERTYKGFVRSGAALTGSAKARIGEVKTRLAELGTRFSQNVLADESAFTLPLTAQDDLAGLPDFLVSAAAATARERGVDANGVITLSRSLIEPFLTFSTRRDLRERAWKAWVARGENGGETDNRAIVAEILALRAERAQLLGYPSFAAFKLEDSMAGSPAAVRGLLETVWPKAKQRAQFEAERLRQEAIAEGMKAPLQPWDWRFYAERVRRADHALDEAALKPYFTLDAMIAAAFHTANRLFGLSFHERADLELYHPDARAFDVRDAKGRHIGLFIGDYFARPSKRSGAWMSAFRGQRRLDGEVRPIIVNVCNFAKADAGKPSLLSLDDAHTLFHEFGHGLHGLLSDVTYPSLAGTAVARDFVELPSQLFEHWLLTPEVISRFARHAETGEAMAPALIERIRSARTFNQGFQTVEYLASALVDIAFHAEPWQGGDPMAFEAQVLDALGMPTAIGMRHRTPHFSHVFSGDGYSAGYYSYMWSEVLDADAFQAFEETGDVFDPATAQRLRDNVYAAGGRRKEDQAYLAFRGSLPGIEGLLRKRGLAA